jgi:hypothetical protein
MPDEKAHRHPAYLTLLALPPLDQRLSKATDVARDTRVVRPDPPERSLGPGAARMGGAVRAEFGRGQAGGTPDARLSGTESLDPLVRRGPGRVSAIPLLCGRRREGTRFALVTAVLPIGGREAQKRNILRASGLGLCVWAMGACSAVGEPEVEQTEQEAFSCTPRNCVAVCATCVYRFCLQDGGDPADCRAERDACIEDCHAHGHFLQADETVEE